jgi:mRNA interferase MazF
MRQFEIWWADLREPAGRRPVLLLSRDAAYSYLNKFVAAEITSTIREIATEVLLGETEGLPRVCVVNCDNLRMVARESLTRPVGMLHRDRWIEVKRAVGAALGWRELTDLD